MYTYGERDKLISVQSGWTDPGLTHIQAAWRKYKLAIRLAAANAGRWPVIDVLTASDVLFTADVKGKPWLSQGRSCGICEVYWEANDSSSSDPSSIYFQIELTLIGLCVKAYLKKILTARGEI